MKKLWRPLCLCSILFLLFQKYVFAQETFRLENNPNSLADMEMEENQNARQPMQNISLNPTQDLIFYKEDADTKERLKDVHFRVINSQNKVVFDGFTDEFGSVILENLPLGTYQIIEIEASLGYLREPVPTFVELKGEEKETTIILRNRKLEQQLIIMKEDVDTKERLPGVEFLITNQEDEIVFKGQTNPEGIIRISLSYGTYKITEIESLEGYLLEKNPVQFQIAGTEEEKIITLTNRKITSVPETKESTHWIRVECLPEKRRKRK